MITWEVAVRFHQPTGRWLGVYETYEEALAECAGEYQKACMATITAPHANTKEARQ